MNHDMTAEMEQETSEIIDENAGVDWDSLREIQPGDEMTSLDYSLLQQFSHQLSVLNQQRLDLFEQLRGQCLSGPQSKSSLALLRYAIELYQQK